ncbi:hypothetical protein WJX72_007170 [[Myrmecia] bisecta]|uniref:CRAL-TRIO domain-containing protein n=1 Tax=[Myrmecia] bisecta TaxID=41462 RepID=A0AAW1Q482_9CHLO
MAFLTAWRLTAAAGPRCCASKTPSVQPCSFPVHAVGVRLARDSRSGRQQRQICRAQQTLTKTPPGLSTIPWNGTSEQVKALEELQQRMESCPYGTADAETQQWFLRDRKLDVDEAAQKLSDMLKWRLEFKADSITEANVAEEAATGKAYLHSHLDVNDRPVIIVRAAKHFTGARPPEESKKLCVHLLEKAISELPEGGETILGIFDLRGFTSKNADLGFVRFLVDIFFTYYPKRLGQVLFVDAPWMFQPGWEMVKPWLKKYAALVRFVSRDQLRDEFFTPSTVPEDFR